MGEVKPFDHGLLQRLTQRVARTLAPGRKDKGAEPEGEVQHPAQLDANYHASTVILCKDIAERLVKLYPGWSWAIQPDEKGRVINIYNLQCHNQYGYTIRMKDIMNDPRHRAAVRGAGEILRRFRMPDRFDHVTVAAAPRDPRGNMIPDIEDLQSAKERRNAEIARKLATGEWELVHTAEGPYLRANKP